MPSSTNKDQTSSGQKSGFEDAPDPDYLVKSLPLLATGMVTSRSRNWSKWRLPSGKGRGTG